MTTTTPATETTTPAAVGCRPVADFTCADCRQPQTGATYANRAADDAKICDSCATAADRRQLADAHKNGRAFYVYPAAETRGAAVCNWIGAPLGRIVSVGNTPHPWTTADSWAGRRYYARIQTPAGMFGGWIAAGCASTIRPLRS